MDPEATEMTERERESTGMSRGVGVHNFNLTTQEAEAGGIFVSWRPAYST